MVSPALESLGSFLRETLVEFVEDDAPGEAAALSFYMLLSLVPVLLIIVFVAGMVWGDEAAAGHLSRQAGQIVGPEAAEVIQTVVANAGRSSGGSVAVAVGIATMLFGATNAIARLKAALNRVWDVAPSREALRHYLHVRLTSLAVVLAAAAMLLVASLIASTMITAIRRYFGEGYASPHSLWRWIGGLMLWLAIAILIGLAHRYIPDIRAPWRSAAAGAAATTGFFVLGRTLVGLYIRHAGIGSAYGAAGSLVVAVVWIFYSFLSLLYGAEVAKAWSHRPRPTTG